MVKSGEEFRELFTLGNALFIGVCEGWVMSEEYFMNPLSIQNLGIRNPREIILYSYLLWQVLLCYMDSQLADMETVGCSR